MRSLSAALLLWLAPAAFAADGGDAGALKLQQLYDQAFNYYSEGDYSHAIQTWNDILRLEPGQKTAAKMIKDVQEDIKKKNREKLNLVFAHIKEGRYRTALSGLETLLEAEEGGPKAAPALQASLEEVILIVAETPASTKAWKTATQGLNSVLGPKENLRLAYNSLRYALELNAGEKRFQRLLDWLLSRHPELAAGDSVTPGMTLLEYKRFIALNHIYEGKYHLAVDALNEVLALEPDDHLALKRLGTAYFYLNLKDKAREAWTRAQEFQPEDLQLQKSLDRLKKKGQKE